MARSVRDPLLLRLIWETGGRVSDIADIQAGDFDFGGRLLNLRVKKTRRVNAMPLEEGTLFDVSNFRHQTYGEPIFGINRWQIWNIVRDYGRDIDMGVHPHMFRYGLAIHLLNQNVPTPIISARAY